MKYIEFWVVEESFDRDVKVVGRFTDEVAARTVSTGKNAMYRSIHKSSITLFDSVDDFEKNTRDKIRDRAIAKLTPEEREALGIK